KRGAQPGSPDFARAIAAGERAVQLKPDFNLARDVLSRLYLESGKTQLAIEQCRRALAIDPKDETALYRLIRALKASGTKSDSSEIPALLRRLADARRLAQKREGEASRYRLVEEMPSASPGAHTN
ncbi:MAG TPA: tetratricopeptide repeat protein, partial [Bryobacteraceae bacterium]|nr:tetratricopeptide repeat protein [Bryobacteraceae bacterium]